MIEKSEITNKEYVVEDCVFFRNIYQISKYIHWGALPVDIFTGSDGKLVFAFTKETHEKFRERWLSCKRDVS